MVIYIGTPHGSSEVHQKVIADLGDDASDDPRMQRLREMAEEGKNALYSGDFARLGWCMNENTEAQRDLHPALVCEAFEGVGKGVCEHICIKRYCLKCGPRCEVHAVR